MILASTTLPDNTGYVAAAYLVVFALVLIYLAIMASKLARLNREIAELHELVDRSRSEEPHAAARAETAEPVGSVPARADREAVPE
jgi:CcmD family protein